MDLETAQRLARHDTRRVIFDGKMNCRDLGGLPTAEGGETARGRVYRSGRLSNLAAADDPRFAALGVQHIVDLRLPFERERFPNRVPDGSSPVQHHHGYLPHGAMDMFEAVNLGTITADEVRAGMHEQYIDMATGHPEIHAALFRHIATPDDLPVLLHCSGGKDRTGVASALLLSIAGVPRETVVADYLLTNLDVPQLGVLTPDTDPELAAVVGRAHAFLIEAALDAVESRYDSWLTFMSDGVGLTSDEAARLVAVLTEPD